MTTYATLTCAVCGEWGYCGYHEVACEWWCVACTAKRERVRNHAAELLAACEAVLARLVEMSLDSGEMGKTLRDVIAKAKGTTDDA